MLGRDSGSVVCVKTTTDKRGYYASRPELLPGCVIYEAGVIPQFEERTIVEFQPDSIFPVENAKLLRSLTAEPSRILGTLPPDTHAKVIAAVKAAPRLDVYGRQYLGLVLGVRF